MAERIQKDTTKKTESAKRKSTKKVSMKEKTTTPLKLESTASEKNISPRSLKVKRSYVLTVIAVFLIVAIAYYGRSLVVAAMVNGQPVTRLSIIRELEKQAGKQTLDSLIIKSLILQEAQKRKISVTQKEVDDEIKIIESNLEKQGQKLDQVLALQGLTKEQVVEQIRIQKMLEKMAGDTSVTDKEIDEYITSNKETLPQDQDEKTLRENVKKSLEQQKLNNKEQELIDNLRKDAKINYFVQY